MVKALMLVIEHKVYFESISFMRKTSIKKRVIKVFCILYYENC